MRASRTPQDNTALLSRGTRAISSKKARKGAHTLVFSSEARKSFITSYNAPKKEKELKKRKVAQRKKTNRARAHRQRERFQATIDDLKMSGAMLKLDSDEDDEEERPSREAKYAKGGVQTTVTTTMEDLAFEDDIISGVSSARAREMQKYDKMLSDIQSQSQCHVEPGRSTESESKTGSSTTLTHRKLSRKWAMYQQRCKAFARRKKERRTGGKIMAAKRQAQSRKAMKKRQSQRT